MWFRQHALVLLLFTFYLLGHSPVNARGGGMESSRHGDPRQAIKSLRQARETAPLDPRLKNLLATNCLIYGLELLEEGKFAEALALFLEGYELEPENSQFSFHLGHILFRQGDLGEAEAYLLESLRKSGPPADIYRLLASVYYKQGRLYEAQGCLEQGLAMQPEEGSRKFLEKIVRELSIEEKMGNRHGGNFQITYVAGGEQLGDEALEVLRDAYAELGTLFNVFPEQAVAVILYGNRDFAAVTGAPAWAGGAYDGKIRVPVGGLRQMNADLQRILYHEYAHVLMFTVTRGNMPRWLDEGLAQIAGGEGDPRHLAQLQQAGKNAGLLSLDRLERTFAALSGEEAAAAYLQTRIFTDYLLDRYGWPRMLDLLQALGRGEKFVVAMKSFLYTGEDFALIRHEWEREEGLVFSRPLQ